MSKSSDFQPNWASTPGDTIADILKERDLSLQLFAKKMNSSIDYTKELIHGYISITEDIAKRLETVLGASAEFWLRREAKYRESINRIGHLAEEKWLNELPINDMVAFGWLERTNNLIEECLKYFEVRDIWTWRRKYNDVIALTAFRKSTTIKSIPASVSAWLRQGEIQSMAIPCQPWNSVLFTEILPKIKQLIKKKKPIDFINELKNICAGCGVAVAIVKTPKGCTASGATKFISPNKAMVLLSFRYLSDDHFWFTFFHEAAHLLLHSNKTLFIEEDDENFRNNIYEKEANQFATEVLIPKHLQVRLRTMRIDKREIMNVAKEADVSLGIIVGQLQHIGRVDFKNLNSFKRRYSWKDILL